MQKQGIYKILSNTPLTKSVYKMVLEGDTSAITAPGQFINIELTGKFLRRPISICDWNETTITIIYKVVGHGTEQMRDMTEGKLDVLTGLGNGYDTKKSGDAPLLIGGGVGVPPMFLIAKELIAQGKKVTAILGFNKKEEIFCEEDFKAIGAEVDKYRTGGEYADEFPDRWLPGALAIVGEAFTEQNGLVNSTMKVVRGKVEEHFADRIEYVYTPEGKKIDNPKNLESIAKIAK